MNEIRFVVSPRIMGEEKFFGPGIAVLLHRVEAYRSIRQAPGGFSDRLRPGARPGPGSEGRRTP